MSRKWKKKEKDEEECEYLRLSQRQSMVTNKRQSMVTNERERAPRKESTAQENIGFLIPSWREKEIKFKYCPTLYVRGREEALWRGVQ